MFFLFALAGCTAANLEAEKIKVDNPLKPARSTDFQEFTASIEPDTYTKATADAQSLKVSWEYTDEVLIVDSRGHKAIYSPLKEEGVALGSVATLCRVSGDTLVTRGQDPDISYKAYYPSTLLEQGLQAVQTFDSPDSHGPVPMIAEGTGTLEFSFLCADLELEYSSSSTIIVKKIAVTSDSPLSGPADISFSPVGITLTGEASSNGVTYDYNVTGYTYKASKIKSFHLFVPEGQYTGFKAEIFYYTSADSTVRSLTSTMEYKVKAVRGKQLTVDLNNPAGKEINLSRYGTANCYPISAGEEFYFTPTKGCSDMSVGAIDTVEVLWQTDNSSVVPADTLVRNLRFDSVENVIRFSALLDSKGAPTPGNVLIAARDKERNILWSWHIWIMETAIQDLVFDETAGVYGMDRYLGMFIGTAPAAKSPSVCPGILYQWGRKDPMPGMNTHLGSSGRGPVAVAGQQTQMQDGPASVEASVANPCTFYTGAGNWCEVPDGLWAEEKTIYDPCPAGYRVLDSLTLCSGKVWNILQNVSATGDQYYRWSSEPSYVFPYCSYYKTDHTFAVLGSTSLWTLTETASTAVGYFLSGNPKKTPGALKYADKGCACGVRCQKLPQED